MSKQARAGLLLFFLAVIGCGVRGRPMPPESPTPIGRGKPTFSKATKGVTLPEPAKQKTEKSEAPSEGGL